MVYDSDLYSKRSLLFLFPKRIHSSVSGKQFASYLLLGNTALDQGPAHTVHHGRGTNHIKYGMDRISDIFAKHIAGKVSAFISFISRCSGIGERWHHPETIVLISFELVKVRGIFFGSREIK